MATLPNFTRFSQEDFRDQMSWIPKLLSPLNSVFLSVFSALNRNLTANANMAGEIKTFTHTAGTELSWVPACGRPLAVLLAGISGAETGAALTAPVTILWSWTASGRVQLDVLTGVVAGKKYKVTLWVQKE